MTASTQDQDARLRELAHSLGCITDTELRELANITVLTEDAWRKRGTGPSYIRFGNSYLYPRAAVAEHLQNLIRKRGAYARTEQALL